MTPDVNVLVAAFRPEHPHHAGARQWLTGTLEDCAAGGTLEVLPMVATGFVRIVTNKRAFPNPDKAADALAFIRQILSVPGVTMPGLGPEWGAFEKLCEDLALSGADVADAWIAAAIKAHGLRLVTFDTDFGRLLDSSECLLLQPRSGVQERHGTYAVRRMARRRARVAA